MKTVYDPACFSRAKIRLAAEKKVKWAKAKMFLYYFLIFFCSGLFFCGLFILILLQLSDG